MALTDVTIASRALNLIGAAEISSFAQGDNPANMANNLYEPMLEAALTRTRWRFATGQSKLSRLVAEPIARWEAAYQIPTSPPVLLVNALTVNDDPITFDRYEDKVYCNTHEDDVVVMDYTYRPEVIYWPPYFTRAFTFEMASVFAGSLAMRGDLADHFTLKAERAFVQAKNADSASQTTRHLRASTLVNIRRS